MHSFGEFALLECSSWTRVPRRIFFSLFVLHLDGAGLGTFDLEFPVLVDDMIAADPDHPSHERARFGPVRRESSIDLQEDVLSQILGLVKSSRKAIRQIVDPLMKLANYSFPGHVVAGQAAFHQLRIGRLQPIWLRPLPLHRVSVPYKSTKWREEKFQIIRAFLR